MAAPGAEAQNTEISESRSHRTRFIIIAVVVALALFAMIWAAFGENTRYFLTVSEFNDKQAVQEIEDGQMVRVSGKLVEGTFDRPEKSTVSHFQITDKEGANSGSAMLLATYDGVLPDLFFNPTRKSYWKAASAATEFSKPAKSWSSALPSTATLKTSWKSRLNTERQT